MTGRTQHEMRRMDQETTLLEHITVNSGRGARAGVIWLHGLGADGHDFEPIVEELRVARRLPIRFVFPHAPQRPVTLNNGYVMRAWYDVVRIDANAPQDIDGIADSAQEIDKLINRLEQDGIAADHIVLAGFSQGGALALHAGLRQPRKLAGIMSLSSYLPLADRLERERDPANQDTPIFMGHGIFDTVVKFELGEKCRDRLQALGYAVAWHEYTMMHSVCPEEIDQIDAWLTKILVPSS
jgi:phospholipase/carboxylesterase